VSAAFLAPHRLTGIAAPMTVWALHFVAVYAMQGLACAQGWQRAPLAGRETVFWWLLLVTLAALVAIAALGLRAWRALRRAGDGDAARQHRFATRVTLAASAMAALAVAFTATPIFLLPTCS
jgi:heme/copper-type cytochrome/quinol oxidase subunit 2